MSDQFNVKTQRKPEAPGVKDRSKGVSLVWLLPIVAALIGLSMAAHSILSKGPEIKVTFLSAEGLVAGKTQVKYKNVVIGQVSDITLSDDRDHAVATVQLEHAAKALQLRIHAFGWFALESVRKVFQAWIRFFRAPSSELTLVSPLKPESFLRVWKVHRQLPMGRKASATH